MLSADEDDVIAECTYFYGLFVKTDGEVAGAAAVPDAPLWTTATT